MKRSKGSRELHRSNEYRKDVVGKKKMPNKWALEEKYCAENAEKIVNGELPMPEDNNLDYRILDFYSVFNEISDCVKCKNCDGNMTFNTEGTKGLGFKILLHCAKCQPVRINSCPKIGNGYEINPRFSLAMRSLGIGTQGESTFCGLMDLPPPFSQKPHSMIRKNIHEASKAVAKVAMKSAVNEEQERTLLEEDQDTNLGVSGDGTWHKRGYSSLFGASTLIGVHSGKIVDVVVKSSYCKACQHWSKKEGTAEFEEWQREHENQCAANHSGSAGKMEVDAIVEMFKRSEKEYGVKYVNYIGDGDSKTYKGIVESKPYGEEIEVKKKECIGHVQKRMGSRLRKCKKENKGIGGRNKLSAKMIDKLTIYYGLAIRRNFDSVQNMHNAIWATFFHYSSTEKDPQHHFCPQGSESWCEWQRAAATGTLDKYEQSYVPLPANVLSVIRPIYVDLSNETLLQRCLGGFTQNRNESFNSVLWRLAPKHIPSSTTIIETAAYLAVAHFNNGAGSSLKVMATLGLKIGRRATEFASSRDSRHFNQAELRAQHATREARIQRRLAKNKTTEEEEAQEGSLYGPGVDDFM